MAIKLLHMVQLVVVGGLPPVEGERHAPPQEHWRCVRETLIDQHNIAAVFTMSIIAQEFIKKNGGVLVPLSDGFFNKAGARETIVKAPFQKLEALNVW